MSGVLWTPATKEQIEMDEEIQRLLKEAKPMTAEDRYWQRRSWLIGEIGMEHPDWSREHVEQLVDGAMETMGYVKPALRAHATPGTREGA